MAKKLKLSGCIETSSRLNTRTGFNDNFFGDMNDVFSMAACQCVDQTTRELEYEYSMLPQDGNLTQAYIPNRANGKLNNTVCYKNQSEENIIFRAKMNNDSFYSFAL